MVLALLLVGAGVCLYGFWTGTTAAVIAGSVVFAVAYICVLGETRLRRRS